MSLDFHTITTGDYDILFPYIDKYGEHSCTWSFVHMFKYADSFYTEGECIYLMRDHLNSSGHRVYMVPLCEKDYLPAAIKKLQADAKEQDYDFEFNNVTNAAAQIINEFFPGEFTTRPDRDWAEYIYSSKALASFAGRRFSGIRNNIKHFNLEYGKNCTVKRFGTSGNTLGAGSIDGSAHDDDGGSFCNCLDCDDNSEVIRDILSFQEKWLDERLNKEDYDELCAESLRITNMLENCCALHISGIAIYYKENVIGYAFGAPNSSKCFDIIAEKGDVGFRGIYQKLVSATASYVKDSYELINREEDVGIEGLRTSKLHYGPIYLLEKNFMTWCK